MIVLLMDVNENISHGEWHSTLSSLGLKEAITNKHKDSHGLVPTYQLGSELIDGIYISEVLKISSGGYFLFGVSLSDHRAVWIKLKVEDVFGYKFR